MTKQTRSVNKIGATAILAFGMALIVCGQTASSAFAVASVRPSEPSQESTSKVRINRVTTTPGNVAMRGISLAGAIEWAYNVEAFQVVGPPWMENTFFDIVAKADGAATDSQIRLMTQNLLASRFQLAVHRDTKEMAAMALVVGKSGSKLKASQDQGESNFQPVSGKPIIRMTRTTMREFAVRLSETMHKPVVDLTGLDGPFDFTLDVTKYSPAPPDPGQAYERVDMAYLILRALQDELGLTLESRKMAIDRVIVDSVQKTPTGN
jgi:uncharacterized protein (TIGR03435 family)